MRRFPPGFDLVIVLVVLAAVLSVLTWNEQFPEGAAGGEQAARELASQYPEVASVMIVTRSTTDDLAFANACEEQLTDQKVQVVAKVAGSPIDVRRKLVALRDNQQTIDAIVCHPTAKSWQPVTTAAEIIGASSKIEVLAPSSYYWPAFLKRENLINIPSQMAVIAILAVGMTLVIISGGIDLSVGSLVALSAVVIARLIRDVAGAEQASTLGMLLCGLAAVACCAGVGAISGSIIALLKMPPFIVTLTMMLITNGLAYIISQRDSISQVPQSMGWLGNEASLLGIPNCVVLMAVVYGVGELLLQSSVFGRHLYATGGNPQAALLCGIRTERLTIWVYLLGGALAGLGGVVLASQLRSGAATYGLNYELQTIAAVVVGGTSLSGGEGTLRGTLLGALILGVIANGMNLLGLDTDTQRIMLGLVILGAVGLDRVKSASWWKAAAPTDASRAD